MGAPTHVCHRVEEVGWCDQLAMMRSHSRQPLAHGTHYILYVSPVKLSPMKENTFAKLSSYTFSPIL